MREGCPLTQRNQACRDANSIAETAYHHTCANPDYRDRVAQVEGAGRQ